MPIVFAAAVPHPPVILPQVGKGGEAKISDTISAFKKAMQMLAEHKPETVVIISPHAEGYADWIHISPGKKARGSMAQFGAPQHSFEAEYDDVLANVIEAEAQKMGIPAGTDGMQNPDLDHGTMVPLYFLDEQLSGYKLVRMGLSGLGRDVHYRLGQAIAAACGEKRVAVIASGDLSHHLSENGPYGFVPEGPRLDALITSAFKTGDFGGLLAIEDELADKGGECGLRSFVIMAGTLDGRDVKAELLSYEGPFGVGYAVAVFTPGGKNENRRFLAAYEQAVQKKAAEKRAGEDEYIKLARHSIESYVTTGAPAALPSILPKEMEEKAGIFVSIHKAGALRGCIGTIGPAYKNIAEEILNNAIAAATEDPRFSPITKTELPMLEISVDVLMEPEDIESMEELNPQEYGVIVSSGMRRGLLLPKLDGVDTAQQQVDIARQKAGISEGQKMKMQRFKVIRHE